MVKILYRLLINILSRILELSYCTTPLLLEEKLRMSC